MEENSFQVALRSALSELKDGSMVELSERCLLYTSDAADD